MEPCYCLFQSKSTILKPRMQYIKYCTLLDQPDCSISNTVLFSTNQIADILYISRNKQYYKSKPLLTLSAMETSFGPRICFMPLCNMSEILSISCHWSLSIPLENIREPQVFWYFQGYRQKLVKAFCVFRFVRTYDASINWDVVTTETDRYLQQWVKFCTFHC